MTIEKLKRFIVGNLTPHPIKLYGDDGQIIIEWPKSVTLLRLVEKREKDGIFVCITYTLPENAPPEVEGVFHIVSLPVLMAMPYRKDFIAPDTGTGAVRDAQGQIIGTKGFIQIKN